MAALFPDESQVAFGCCFIFFAHQSTVGDILDLDQLSHVTTLIKEIPLKTFLWKLGMNTGFWRTSFIRLLFWSPNSNQGKLLAHSIIHKHPLTAYTVFGWLVSKFSRPSYKWNGFLLRLKWSSSSAPRTCRPWSTKSCPPSTPRFSSRTRMAWKVVEAEWWFVPEHLGGL